MIKAGDMVSCINNDDRDNQLTLNKKYKVLRVKFDFLGVKDNLGEYFEFVDTRFKTATITNWQEEIQ